jgi:hypothetical protein
MRSSSTSIRPARQGGTAAVEFALVALVFFSFVFGALEVARAAYLWSTLTQVMNRAARGAAVANPSDAAAMAQVRQNAMFGNAAGKLAMAGNIDVNYLHIEYLARDAATVVTVLPPCPVQNIANCINDPNGSCIRFVRVSLCLPSTNCDPVPYTSLVGLDALASFRFNMPTFTTVVAAQTLGMPAACSP